MNFRQPIGPCYLHKYAYRDKHEFLETQANFFSTFFREVVVPGKYQVRIYWDTKVYMCKLREKDSKVIKKKSLLKAIAGALEARRAPASTLLHEE